MAANIETMMFTGREVPWHGLGVNVKNAPTSRDAIMLSGLDWKVVQRGIRTVDGMEVAGFKANVRDTDRKILGVVTDRYRVVQNEDAFEFTDVLLGEGVQYETAGSLHGGKRTWVLARMPHRYIICGDEITPYLVVMNSHDGTSGIRVAMTPIRVVCQNTLNFALSSAKRSWSANHVGDIKDKLDDARNSLLYANHYMTELGRSIEDLNRKKLSDQKVYEYIDALFPTDESGTVQQKKNIKRLKDDVKMRYFDAPDLQHVDRSAYRFVNAVSDFATHARPLREHANYKENLFARTVDGNAMIDKAYSMLKAA